jgi:bifunctional UDP-N-acetylglucosamine pyrophosphorylase/glucosamine-1-phosphate N-acetyltransferase
MNIVILAAGKGTRLKQNVAKPLCRALEVPIVDYVIQELTEFKNSTKLEAEFNFIVGHQKDEVQSHIQQSAKDIDPKFTWQKEQLGTGHALMTFFNENPSAKSREYTLVVCADTPLLTSDIFTTLYNSIKENSSQAVCATFKTENPTGYGRIERGEQGFRIVEEKDASNEQRLINEVNSALYIFKTSHIENRINSLDQNNKAGEFYLTDLLKIGDNVIAEVFEDESSFIGINDLHQLSEVEELLLKKKLKNLSLEGVRLIKPSTIYIGHNCVIEQGSTIGPNTFICGKSHIMSGSLVEAGSTINNSIVGCETQIKSNSYLEGATIGNHCTIGPMARLREGTVIEDNCKLGNFVETKKSHFHKGSKASHLSYIGDAEIGENTNLGCGFITCNYDGKDKHKTKIGKDSFIGSDSQVVAPIEIGNECFVASGSTLTDDLPDKSFAIARQKQVTKKDYAKRFLKSK